MYIKSIVLDGFKSYGHRVEITGFDPQFNAITGLNGTGKSNILDAICFVLGITNLSNVRAGSLQELIYKHGQAGILKASVSITFDNTNRSQQPLGYDSREITVTRQVVMGGKNKYLINGNNVQNKRVLDMFCSIQLNVNNPHFLIMQGRITKVLNMKPPEILSMVEEAAGTRMYEAKKQSAQKTIERKDTKLQELNELIEHDIAPAIERLQAERAQVQEHQKVLRQLENLTKLSIAWKYVTAEEKTKEAEAKVQQAQDAIKAKKDSVTEIEAEVKNIEEEIAQLNRALDEESGSVLQQLQAEVVQLEAADARSGAAVQACLDAAAGLDARAAALQRALLDERAALRDKQQQLAEMSAAFGGLRAASEGAERALHEAQARFLAVSTGREDPAGAPRDQLMAATEEASVASTNVATAEMELQHCTARLRTLQQEFRAGAAQFARDQAAIAAHQEEIDSMQTQLSTMNFDSARNESLRESVRSLQGGVRAARDRHDELALRLHRCQFNYTPPPGFDRSRVSGTVSRLFTVTDSSYDVALETVAAGRLYHVVVDTDVTSRLLLERGQLQNRTTIIPLNKITSQCIDRNTLRAAQEIGGGPANVQLALDLVSYAPRVQRALAWVFGGSLVCRDLDTARRVTFDPRVRRRCVTLDGDVCDPQGTLFGGARRQETPVLRSLAELRAAEEALAAAEAALQRDTAALQRDQRAFDEYHALQQRHQIKSHELQMVKARLATSAQAQLHDEIASLETRIPELKASIERNKQVQKEAAARVKDLEVKVKDITGHREREYKKAEIELKRAKKAAEEHGGRWRGHDHELETLQLESGELQRAVESGAVQLEEELGAARAARERLPGLRAQHAAHLNATAEMHSRIERQKAEIVKRSGALRKLTARAESRRRAARAAELDAARLQADEPELRAGAGRCRHEMASLLTAHEWIAAERQYFGLSGSAYDFEELNAAGAGARVRELTARRDQLARGLNVRAHALLQQQQEQYADVLRKKAIVEADRAKLVAVMAELDEKKRNTLRAACAQVNRDFGAMFGTLLSGAQARLEPPAGRSVLDGLEVRVGFNGAWKESLGELSGGQRSLVALSLVLAMLQFQPAPLYVLDEVDAALDLAHTQNIGTLLRTHFRDSQFIIVSLKDGMFNNANVLFRTRFEDGMSAVQRTVNQSH